MKLLAFITFILFFNLSLKGQTIIRDVQSSAGISNTSGTIILSSTIGEPMDITLTDGNEWLIQGFEQPLYDTSVATFTIENKSIKISIYPNPTSGPLQINLDSQLDNLRLSLDIFNIAGQSMMYETMLNQFHTIDMSHLPAATYLLRIRNPKGEIIQTFKIQKIH